jgi:glutamate/tyrosine decarboxylase-like PLP-dependent enzyme
MSNKNSAASLAEALEQYLGRSEPEHELDLDGKGGHSLAAWFLGPKGENTPLFHQLVTQALEVHARDRRNTYKTDPPWITKEVKESAAYGESVTVLQTEYEKLLTSLEGSVPFFSYRYQAHMLWDVTMPGMLGYFAGMLYNQNNVAAEASPVTTPLEMQVGEDLCQMLGYPVSDDPNAIQPWGHITCDGSVANMEAMWAARNLKYYPVAFAAALKHEKVLAPARDMVIGLPNGTRRKIRSLTTWQLLNLPADDVLAIPTRLLDEYKISNDVLTVALQEYSLPNLGFTSFERKFLKNTPPPVVIGPGTMHYSWPKAAALLGLGQENLILLNLDLNARMETDKLRSELKKCLKAGRPVIMVISVLGSTEESAVDPLDEILNIRQEFRMQGLEFPIHVDGAWGGYFASLLRGSEHPPQQPPKSDAKHTRQYTPEMVMNHHVVNQYKVLHHADSITLDPHKSGYQPYPAGGLCYRNSSMRNLVSLKSPVVYHGDMTHPDPTVGVYGIEGSKPGAAAAGVYLNHRVIGTDREGYGKILGKCCFNSKRFYAALVTMASDDDDFIVVPVQRLPAEREGKSAREIRKQMDFIRERIVSKTNDELLEDPEAMELFRELGPDLVITTYAFNFKTKRGLNRDVTKMNNLNTAIFEELSIAPTRDDVQEKPMIVTSSDFDPTSCGQPFVEHFMKRLGVRGKPETSIAFLISTTMDPWLTDTAKGNYIPTLIDALHQVVMKKIRAL